MCTETYILCIALFSRKKITLYVYTLVFTMPCFDLRLYFALNVGVMKQKHVEIKIQRSEVKLHNSQIFHMVDIIIIIVIYICIFNVKNSGETNWSCSRVIFFFFVSITSMWWYCWKYYFQNRLISLLYKMFAWLKIAKLFFVCEYNSVQKIVCVSLLFAFLSIEKDSHFGKLKFLV